MSAKKQITPCKTRGYLLSSLDDWDMRSDRNFGGPNIWINTSLDDWDMRSDRNAA